MSNAVKALMMEIQAMQRKLEKETEMKQKDNSLNIKGVYGLGDIPQRAFIFRATLAQLGESVGLTLEQCPSVQEIVTSLKAASAWYAAPIRNPTETLMMSMGERMDVTFRDMYTTNGRCVKIALDVHRLEHHLNSDSFSAMRGYAQDIVSHVFHYKLDNTKININIKE